MTNKYSPPDAVKQAFAAVDAENIDKLRQYLADGDENARNEHGLTLLQYAASRNRYISATVLLEGGADPDMKSRGTHGYTALHYAAENDNAELVKLLAQYNAGLNVADKNRQTPLHIAAEHGNPKAVMALTRAGADMFAEDRFGRTPLETATHRKHEALDFEWQEYIDIEKHLSRRMEEHRTLASAFKQAQDEKVENDRAALKKHNPNRYKLGQ
jgi:ankyrin repeat protein